MNKPVITSEERKCEEHFTQTYSINNQGKFVVRMPLKGIVLQNLGDSYDNALKRFYSLKRKLNRHPDLKIGYTQFINDYLNLNYTHLMKSRSKRRSIISHHAVIKTSSATTRLRVVFDASCKTDSGVPLNDALMVGSSLQQKIFTILKFRTWQYVLIGDVKYRQVLVHEDHRNLQRYCDALKKYRFSN